MKVRHSLKNWKKRANKKDLMFIVRKRNGKKRVFIIHRRDKRIKVRQK